MEDLLYLPHVEELEFPCAEATDAILWSSEDTLGSSGKVSRDVERSIASSRHAKQLGGKYKKKSLAKKYALTDY